MDRSAKQNINKGIVTLNNALDEIDSTNMYILLLSSQRSKIHILFISKYTFFSNTHGTFSKIDHMKRHKTSLNKFKKIEIISIIFSDHKELKRETSLKEKTQKHSNSWRLNSILTH